jgi:hypothetical protein
MMKYFAVLPLVVLLYGCAGVQPKMWLDKVVSLPAYRVFEVAPASNDTEKTFEFDVAATLTEHLKSKLQEKGYRLSEDPARLDDVLVIKSSLVAYKPGSAFARWAIPGAGTTLCVVRNSLFDKRTGRLVGEMVTGRSVSAGGLFTVGADKWILEVTASAITDELDKRVKGE